MNGATLQAKIYAGYAKVASKIGLTYTQYRPTSAGPAIAAGNLLSTFPASFNAEDFNYGKPNKYGKPTWYGVYDGSKTVVGDYLVGPGGTFFVAAQQQALPILVVETNHTLTISRPSQTSGVGAQGYGGDVVATETALMTGWPASVLQGTKGEKTLINLPGDVRSPWWSILLPVRPGVILRGEDVIIDETNKRYVISSAELTDLGWRISAMQAET